MVLHRPFWSIAECLCLFVELLLFLCVTFRVGCTTDRPLHLRWFTGVLYVSVVFPSGGTAWSSLLDTMLSLLTLISLHMSHFSPTVSYTHNASLAYLTLCFSTDIYRVRGL